MRVDLRDQMCPTGADTSAFFLHIVKRIVSVNAVHDCMCMSNAIRPITSIS